MNKFTYSYPTKVYFGQDAAKTAFAEELPKVGKTVMLAYDGGSIRRNGIYDEMVSLLKNAGKEVVEFFGIMPNPTYAKVQEGAALVRDRQVDFILAVGGSSVIDCCQGDFDAGCAGWRYLGIGIWQRQISYFRDSDGSCGYSFRNRS